MSIIYVLLLVPSADVTLTLTVFNPVYREILPDASPLFTKAPFTVMVWPSLLASAITLVFLILSKTTSKYFVLSVEKLGFRGHR